MDVTDIAAGVFLGGVLTVCFVWACFQFHKHDYSAPWLAYAGFLMPLLFAVLSLVPIEGTSQITAEDRAFLNELGLTEP